MNLTGWVEVREWVLRSRIFDSCSKEGRGEEARGLRPMTWGWNVDEE